MPRTIVSVSRKDMNPIALLVEAITGRQQRVTSTVISDRPLSEAGERELDRTLAREYVGGRIDFVRRAR